MSYDDQNSHLRKTRKAGSARVKLPLPHAWATTSGFGVRLSSAPTVGAIIDLSDPKTAVREPLNKRKVYVVVAVDNKDGVLTLKRHIHPGKAVAPGGPITDYDVATNLGWKLEVGNRLEVGDLVDVDVTGVHPVAKTLAYVVTVADVRGHVTLASASPLERIVGLQVDDLDLILKL